MIHLGGKADSAEDGYRLAEAALKDGSALRVFLEMVAAQSGDVRVFDDPVGFHKPGATEIVAAWESGFVAEMDTTALGWAVQRTGAGREKAGEPVDPHAGILFHARRGAKVERGQEFATVYATRPEMLAEPVAIIKRAVTISETPPHTAVPLVGSVFTKESAENYLQNAVR
jgi:pyrimidine-nucleoside phosphorylase